MSLRLALVALVWLLILGGTAVFLRQETPAARAVAPVEIQVAGGYALEVTTTFDVAEDPFALKVGDQTAQPLAVNLSGEEIFSSDSLAAHQPARVEVSEGLVAGLNEFLVTATPPQDYGSSHAVRLRLLRGGVPLAEETFWAEAGQNVVGALRVEIERPHEDER